ncbi:endospore germination permease [Paenibacillus athensensis]|nr:endospore germination permease [Paenibacillus athensensis]MCD1257422.1 endospore germination permease [Paenibacillus athensensis]
MIGKSGAAIGTIPAFSIIILATGLMNHVMVIPPLLQAAHRDAWLSVLAIIPLYLVWTGILFIIMRRTNQQAFFPWLQTHCGKWISGAVRACFIVYLFLICTLTMKDTAMWTHTSYLPRTPQWILSVTLLMLCCYAAHAGLRSIAICAGILLPFVIVFGDFVLSANLPVKNYHLLFPVMEQGVQPLLQGTVYVGGGLVEIIILLLFQHQLKKKIPLWSLLLLAVFLVMLVFGPLTGAIAEFGPVEAAKLRYPAYEEWRLVSVGQYIRHLDFLSIYQWLSGAFVRISTALLLLVDLLSGGGSKRRMVWFCGLGLTLIALVELPISDMQYLQFMQSVYLPAALTVMTALLLLLFVLALIRGHKGEMS